MKSVYIHIPFCNTICSYCDFPKFYYNKTWVNNYLKDLKEEINLNYKGEVINTIYIGGGTPSALRINELKELLDIIKIFKVNKNIEYTIEVNIESIDEDKLKLMNEYQVNRISIGIETVNERLLKLINRHHNEEMVINKYKLIKKYFSNISVDLMYALPTETVDELEYDLDFILALKPNHISTYSLILEPNTKLYIDNYKNVDQDLDYQMYELIKTKLKDYNHYEVSNFGLSSFHNLVYWNNLEYYGFGLGASGYINGYRYTNTRSYNNYINGKYIKDNYLVSLEEDMSNFMILGLRKLEGVSKRDFFKRYHKSIKEVYDINLLLKDNKLIETDTHLYINPSFIYTSNEILINFI